MLQFIYRNSQIIKVNEKSVNWIKETEEIFYENYL